LGAIQELDVDAMRLLYRIECSGEDFYNLIAERIGNDRAADLLRKNAREERGHAERVRKGAGDQAGTEKYEPPRRTAPSTRSRCPTRSAELFALIVQARSTATRATSLWADRESDAEVQRLLPSTARGNRARPARQRGHGILEAKPS